MRKLVAVCDYLIQKTCVGAVLTKSCDGVFIPTPRMIPTVMVYYTKNSVHSGAHRYALLSLTSLCKWKSITQTGRMPTNKFLCTNLNFPSHA